MYFKLLLSDEENKELELKAQKLGLDKTAYIKKCLDLQASKENIFTVEYAVSLVKKLPHGTQFTLYELYGDSKWCKIRNGVAGVLGRNFYTYVSTVDDISFIGKKEVFIGEKKRLLSNYIKN